MRNSLQLRNSTACERSCMGEFGRDSQIAAFEATLCIKSCSRSAGVCERAPQRSRSICCGCDKDGNNRRTFTAKVFKSVFVLFATRGHGILYSDWERRYSVDLYIALNLLLVPATSPDSFKRRIHHHHLSQQSFM